MKKVILSLIILSLISCFGRRKLRHYIRDNNTNYKYKIKK